MPNLAVQRPELKAQLPNSHVVAPRAPVSNITPHVNPQAPKSNGKRFIDVACIIACILVTLVGAAALVGLGLHAAGHASFLADAMGFVVRYVTAVPAWIMAAAMTITGLGSTALKITRIEEANPQAQPAVMRISSAVFHAKQEAFTQANAILKEAQNKVDHLQLSLEVNEKANKKVQENISVLEKNVAEIEGKIKHAEEESKKMNAKKTEIHSAADHETAEADLAAANASISVLDKQLFNFKKEKKAKQQSCTEQREQLKKLDSERISLYSLKKAADVELQVSRKKAEDAAAAWQAIR